MKFAIFQDSRQGGRKYNQDRVAHSYSRESLLLVIADGMGGHLHGEIAAQIAVELLVTQFQKQASPIIEQPWAFLKQAIQQAHEAILGYAGSRNMPETPRTTIVVAILQDETIYWAHVGDSRLYLFRNDACIAMTRDHSKVQQMLENGLITPEEAANHPDLNKIYNCLGSVTSPMIELGGKQALLDGDSVLLCTDGVWGESSMLDMTRLVSGLGISEAIPQMLDLAEIHGGRHGDNLSAIGINWLNDDLPTLTPSISSYTLSDGDFSSYMPTLDKETLRREVANEMTDSDIEAAIAEINHALKKFVR